MSENTTRQRRASVAGWFLAVSYILGAPYAAFLEYRSQLLSQRFDVPPELVYLTSALQLGCAMVILVKPLSAWAAGGLTLTTLGAIALHLRIGSPLAAWAAVLYTAVQVWFGLARLAVRARPRWLERGRRSLEMRLVLWPAVVTLAVTLLRLAGELHGWSRPFFDPATGGGGALVGIVWLPFLFGPWFAWRLAREGKPPKSAGKVAGLALGGAALTIAVFASAQLLGLIPWGVLVALIVALAAAFLPWRAWPELARTLFLYALAARIPVVVVMLFAIYGEWGTHYDVLPPDPTPQLVAAGPLERWFWIGLVPQGTIWIAHTVLVGSLFGALAVALARPRAAAA